jgi:CBS domain-containing protein
MNEPSEVTRHSIAFLRVRGDRDEERSGHVACPRLGGSVPLARCARCPRFVKITPGDAPGQEAVHCHAEAAPKPTDKPLSLPRTAVSDLMTRNVICVRPELSLDAVTSLFVETSLAALPVVDESGRLLGFLGQDEVTLAIQVGGRSSEGPMTVADVLLPFAIAIPETTSLTQAAAVMAFEGQHRLAVTATDGAVVGVLAASDILYWLARADGQVLPPPRSSCRP